MADILPDKIILGDLIHNPPGYYAGRVFLCQQIRTQAGYVPFCLPGIMISGHQGRIKK